MQPMYYIGLDVHKRKISYCVKDSSGRIHAEGSISATRLELDHWMRSLPQPWSEAMEATMFTGWIYDHLGQRLALRLIEHRQEICAPRGPRSTLRNPTQPAIVRTSGNSRSLPSPLAPGLLAASDPDKTSPPPHHWGSTVVRYIHQSLPPKMQSAESSGDNLRLSTCSAPSSRVSGRHQSVLRSREPTLLCNQVLWAGTTLPVTGGLFSEWPVNRDLTADSCSVSRPLLPATGTTQVIPACR